LIQAACGVRGEGWALTGSTQAQPLVVHAAEHSGVTLRA